ncbi:MAG: Flp family type IVb pilin [Gammaproteobacteria bacterium]|nr:Flp family type IVb pilin [Gammaproteobacteria bacterium]
MRKLGMLIKSFHVNEDGAAMVEYTVLIGLITVSLIALILAVQGKLVVAWSTMNSVL